MCSRVDHRRHPIVPPPPVRSRPHPTRSEPILMDIADKPGGTCRTIHSVVKSGFPPASIEPSFDTRTSSAPSRRFQPRRRPRCSRPNSAVGRACGRRGTMFSMSAGEPARSSPTCSRLFARPGPARPGPARRNVTAGTWQTSDSKNERRGRGRSVLGRILETSGAKNPAAGRWRSPRMVNAKALALPVRAS